MPDHFQHKNSIPVRGRFFVEGLFSSVPNLEGDFSYSIEFEDIILRLFFMGSDRKAL